MRATQFSKNFFLLNWHMYLLFHANNSLLLLSKNISISKAKGLNKAKGLKKRFNNKKRFWPFLSDSNSFLFINKYPHIIMVITICWKHYFHHPSRNSFISVQRIRFLVKPLQIVDFQLSLTLNIKQNLLFVCLMWKETWRTAFLVFIVLLTFWCKFLVCTILGANP